MSAARIRLLVIILAVTVGAPAVASAKSGPITFYFGLKRPEASAQQAFFAVSRPGASSYRRFLSLKQVSARTPAPTPEQLAIRHRYGEARADSHKVVLAVSSEHDAMNKLFALSRKAGYDNPPTGWPGIQVAVQRQFAKYEKLAEDKGIAKSDRSRRARASAFVRAAEAQRRSWQAELDAHGTLNWCAGGIDQVYPAQDSCYGPR